MSSDAIHRPAAPSSPEALAQAWTAAANRLPHEWAIHYLHGETTYGDNSPFWIAAAAGPNLDTDYAEGFGQTPDEALLELAAALARFGPA